MLLSSITLKNLLSFKDATLELRPLNVLIGPNGSGKSNFIEVIGLLQAAPVDLNRAIMQGGGVREWIWRGSEEVASSASIRCTVMHEPKSTPYVYQLEFSEHPQGLWIETESFQNAVLGPRQEPTVYFRRKAEEVSFPQSGKGQMSVQESVLRSYRNPTDLTPTTRVGREFERLRIYHEFRTSPNSQTRWGMALGGAAKDFLEDGGQNLALVLQDMQFNGSLRRVTDYMREFCERYHDVRVGLDGNALRAYVVEEGLDKPISAIRLSDGTLKFLCMLTVLLNEKVPPLVCIEEPELGLHPDAVRLVARAIVEASQRTQLIITTHSEALVDELCDRPEAIVVCEYDAGSGTRFERLSKERLEGWLDRYSLGEIWRKGEIGGNRW
jgi:predicted ATPase